MARYGHERRGESRARILETASRRFRAEGTDAVGIASLMADAGLTNGAFYAHFASKDELVNEAIIDALVGVPVDLGLGADSDSAGLRRFIETYLSPTHRDDIGGGCAMAALAPELARRPSKARGAFQTSGKAMIERIAATLPEPIGKAERLPRAFILFSLLLGTLQMARFADDGVSDGILSAGRAEALRLAGFDDHDMPIA